ncbi:MAG: amidohydrolase [Gemmatimonadota bacterium]
MTGPGSAGGRRLAALCLVWLALPCAACGRSGRGGRRADLVLRGGPVFLADSAGTVARAIALRDNTVLAAGSLSEIEATIGPGTRVVELNGRLVTPGMNDAHSHIGSGGLSLLNLRLQGTSSLAEIEARVAEAVSAAAPGEWIEGRGWDHTRLAPEELGPGGWPTKEALDRAAPDNPVYLRRVDGHTAWVNSAALRLAGIGPDTPDPPGGEIILDPATGAPTGILKETAEELVARVIPEPSDATVRRAIRAVLDLARRTGVTSVQTSATRREIRMYRELLGKGELTARVYAWLPLTAENIAAYRRDGITAGFGDAWLRVGMLKGYSDGTLGSRTAWMLEPYTDDPSTRGIVTVPLSELEGLIREADEAGLQVTVHAIGDAANRAVLDAFASLVAAGAERTRRHRIEHAQILDRADIPRFARLGVIASMQPTHATSDMRWAETLIGRERAEEGAYAWRSLLDAGAAIAFGTDFAVEPLAPIEGIYSAVTRQSREEPGTPAGGWIPAQRLSVAEAIRLYTAGSAYAEFEEERKGTLEPGMLADLVVWDRDLMSVSPEELLEASPDLTIVDGQLVYETD